MFAIKQLDSRFKDTGIAAYPKGMLFSAQVTENMVTGIKDRIRSLEAKGFGTSALDSFTELSDSLFCNLFTSACITPVRIKSYRNYCYTDERNKGNVFLGVDDIVLVDGIKYGLLHGISSIGERNKVAFMTEAVSEKAVKSIGAELCLLDPTAESAGLRCHREVTVGILNAGEHGCYVTVLRDNHTYSDFMYIPAGKWEVSAFLHGDPVFIRKEVL